MPDLLLVLEVLIASLVLAAAAALTLAHRAVEPAARMLAMSGQERQSMSRAVRTVAVRGGIALLVGVGALVGSAWIANAAFRDTIGDAVFAAPVLAGAVAVGVYGLLQSRPLIAHPATRASLDARRRWEFAATRSFVAVGALVALMLALVGFAAIATPGFATFAGPRLLALIVLLGALIAAALFASRRIAERAALPPRQVHVDRAIRQIATRFVLLLTMSALLAPIGLVALQSGVWLWGMTAIDANGGAGAVLGGVIVTVVGALATIGSVGSFIAVTLATALQLRSSARITAQPATATA